MDRSGRRTPEGWTTWSWSVRIVTSAFWLVVVVTLGWNLAQLPEAVTMQVAPVCSDPPAADCLVVVMGTVKLGGVSGHPFESSWRFDPATDVVATQEFLAPHADTVTLSSLSEEPHVVALTWHGEVVGVQSADQGRVVASRFGIHGALSRLYVTMAPVLLLTGMALRWRVGPRTLAQPRIEPVALATAIVGVYVAANSTSVTWALVPMALGVAVWLVWVHLHVPRFIQHPG
jgi:hypothetical protein